MGQGYQYRNEPFSKAFILLPLKRFCVFLWGELSPD